MLARTHTHTHTHTHTCTHTHMLCTHRLPCPHALTPQPSARPAPCYCWHRFCIALAQPHTTAKACAWLLSAEPWPYACSPPYHVCRSWVSFSQSSLNLCMHTVAVGLPGARCCVQYGVAFHCGLAPPTNCDFLGFRQWPHEQCMSQHAAHHSTHDVCQRRCAVTLRCSTTRSAPRTIAVAVATRTMLPAALCVQWRCSCCCPLLLSGLPHAQCCAQS
jgi:hypothetical protein